MNGQDRRIAEALMLMARAANIILTAEGAPYRVTDNDIVIARRDGFTLIAIPETRDAVDYRHCAPPYSTMGKAA